METVLPALVLIAALVGAVDFVSYLRTIGDPSSRNAIVKVVLSFFAVIGVLWLAGQTTVAGGYSLSTVLPVDHDVVLKSLSLADLGFIALVLALNNSFIATLRKTFDNKQSASVPSIVSSSSPNAE